MSDKFVDWHFTTDEKQGLNRQKRWEEKVKIINRYLFHKESEET